MPGEPFWLPAIPHRKTGITCNGSVMAIEDGEQITLRCNVCQAVVGSVNTEFLKAWEQAIADSIVMHKFDEADVPQALTSISDECQRGECEKCPGVFQRTDTGDQPVFCVHSCHRVKPQPGSVQ